MNLRTLLSVSAAAFLFTACGPGLDESQQPTEPSAPVAEEAGTVSAMACPPSTTYCEPWEYQYHTGCGAVYTRRCTQDYYLSGCVLASRSWTEQQCR